MEEADKIITELSLCGYVVKDEWIPWVDSFHHRITVYDPFNEERNLAVGENITDEKFKHPEIQYFSISRNILMRKIMKEIKKREWPLETRVLGKWLSDKPEDENV